MCWYRYGWIDIGIVIDIDVADGTDIDFQFAPLHHKSASEDASGGKGLTSVDLKIEHTKGWAVSLGQYKNEGILNA